MIITCLDLEGVLFPEVWIEVSKGLGIEELQLTTRDIQDYDELMRIRLKSIREHNITLSDIIKTIEKTDPFPGAPEFLAWLREFGQALILSDTFFEFSKPIAQKLNMPTILCHSLEVDDNDMIAAYKLRIDDPKSKAVRSFKNLNFTVLAAGDSFNDIGMLKAADYGVLYRSPESIKSQFPRIPSAESFEELKELFSRFLKEGEQHSI